MQTKISTRTISVIGILIAVEVILSRFLSIHTWNLKIGFSFIPVVVAAILYGPFVAGLVGALSDVIGYFIFPVGTFFPGFTLTACLTGIIFALFLHKSHSLIRIIGSVLVTQIFVSLLINTLWISILYGSPYGPLFITRIYQVLAMTIVEIVVIYFLTKKVTPILKNYII